MSAQSHLTALPSPSAEQAGDSAVRGIESAIPECPASLTADEQRVWDHVTEALLEYGLIHKTDGMALVVICRTFIEWLHATEELEKFKVDNGGSYITESANGYRSPHPSYYIARDAKKSLLTWLPEAALTIPSFHKVREAAGNPNQADLFNDDPVRKFRDQKAAIGMRVVGKDE